MVSIKCADSNSLVTQFLFLFRKEFAEQEERYQKQVDQLTLSLAQSQEEVSKLTQSLESLRSAQDTLKQCEELQEKLSLLQQDVRDRNAQLDCEYCLFPTLW